MPWTFAAFLLASISIIGLPPLGGTWSKWFLLLGAVDAEQTVMLIVLLVGSLLALAYLMPIPMRAFFLPAADKPAHGEARLTIAGPLTLTAFGCVALFFGAEAVLAPLAGILELP
jgi:multicomponent Na+:H+ antiporter subunit D